MGTFVEVKNSDIGAGAKVPHLSYIGDADVGERHEPRRGARSPPTTTAAHKHRTTIGERVQHGVDTTFVAPVTVGDDAYTARRLGDHRGRARRRARHRARAPDATSRATPSAASAMSDAAADLYTPRTT